jgi:hypothetical protein
MLERDAVSEVVVPVSILGPPLVTGSPSAGAAAFFMEVLGLDPIVAHGAWVFRLDQPLPVARIVATTRLSSCTSSVGAATASALWSCLMGASR